MRLRAMRAIRYGGVNYGQGAILPVSAYKARGGEWLRNGAAVDLDAYDPLAGSSLETTGGAEMDSVPTMDAGGDGKNEPARPDDDAGGGDTVPPEPAAKGGKRRERVQGAG